MPLISRRLGIDGVVEGERPVEDAAGDLPAVGHLAERGRLDGRGNLRRHGLDRREDRNARRAEPDLREQIDRVLDDVALGVEVGEDVDRRVGDEQRLGIGRHVHDEDVADPPRGAQAGLARGVTARMSSSVCRLPFISSSPLPSWISSTALAAAASLCGASTISNRPMSSSCSRATAAIFAAGPTRIGMMMPASRRLDGAAQRGLVAGMHDDRGRGRHLLRRARSGGRISRAAHAERADLPRRCRSLSFGQHDYSCSMPLRRDGPRCLRLRLCARRHDREVRTAPTPASTPNSRATSLQPLVVLAGRARRARSTPRWIRSNALRRVSASAGSIDGMAASAASWSISSMKNCSRTSALNVGKRHVAVSSRRMRRTASKPRSSTAAARHADIEQRRGSRLRAARRPACAT